MANDRAYIRCKNCGEKHMLFKYYPTLTRYAPNDLVAWVDLHVWCIPTQNDLEGDPQFELSTEEQTIETHPPQRPAAQR